MFILSQLWGLVEKREELPFLFLVHGQYSGAETFAAEPFSFWVSHSSWSPVNQRPLINYSSPAAQQTSSRAFRIWLTPVKQGAFGAQRQRHSAWTSGIHGHGWQMLPAFEL